MPLLLDISTVAKVPREYVGVIIVNFPEMNILNRIFTFVANTPKNSPPGAVVFKDSLPFIFFQLEGDSFVSECEINYGRRTEFVFEIFFQAVRLGVMSIVDFVKCNTIDDQSRINLPISRSVIWEVEDQIEALDGVVCLVCGKEKWLEKI